MQFLKYFFNFYIDSSLHVSIAVFCLTKITLVELGIDEYFTSIFVFLCTVISYNFIKYYEIIVKDIKLKNKFNAFKRNLIALNIICTILIVILFFWLNLSALILLIPFALIIYFYAIPINPNIKNLRNIAGLKLALIAFSWAGVTVLFPIVQYDIQISSNELFVFAQRFLFIIAITIPFDIRDLILDDDELKTLPRKIGVRNSKWVGSIAIILFVILDFLRSSNSIWVVLMVSILSLGFLLFSSKNQSKYYSSFWVESLPIFWLLILLSLN